MNSIFDEKARAALNERIAQVKSDSTAAWGRMNVGEMICHCADGIEMATGERAVRSKSNFVFRWIVRPLAIYVMPMPKGAPTADELKAGVGGTPATDFEADKTRLSELINAMAALPDDFEWAPHAAFGSLTRKQWGLLMHKHIDHHLKQFGA